MTTIAADGDRVGGLAREALEERFGELLRANHGRLVRLAASYALEHLAALKRQLQSAE